jgi:hypothetical protein
MKSSDIEQRERRELSGSTTGMTFHSRAAADIALLDQGRHTQGAEVIGSKPAVVYPRMPEGSPWAADPVPNEEPFGIDLNYVEPVGTFSEIEESLLRDAASFSIPLDDAAEAREVDPRCPPAVVGLSPRAAAGATPKSPSWSPGDLASLTAVQGDADVVGEAASLIRGRRL